MIGQWQFTSLTYEQSKKYHRYLWRWLSRHPGMHKWSWPGWIRFLQIYVINDCFACELADRRSPAMHICGHCPIKEWQKIFLSGLVMCGLACQHDRYGKFLLAQEMGNMPQLKSLALEIAELEWNEPGVCDGD